MYFHLTTRIGELGGMVLSNQELSLQHNRDYLCGLVKIYFYTLPFYELENK